MILQHECQHNETMLQTLQLMQGEGRRPGPGWNYRMDIQQTRWSTSPVAPTSWAPTTGVGARQRTRPPRGPGGRPSWTRRCYQPAYQLCGMRGRRRGGGGGEGEGGGEGGREWGWEVGRGGEGKDFWDQASPDLLDDQSPSSLSPVASHVPYGRIPRWTTHTALLRSAGR